MSSDDRAIAISATFTAEAIQPALAFWAGELGLDHEIRFASYSQVFQTMLDPGGVFAGNHSGFNVVLLRFEDWVRGGGETTLEERACQFVEAVRAAASRMAAPMLLVFCPPTPDGAAISALAEETVRHGVEGLDSVHLIEHAEIARLYPVDEIHDPNANDLGHVPYSPEYFAALATMVARKIHAISTPPFKVLALDCDETLWRGVCGEDGPQGVTLDEPRRALQEFVARKRSEGMLLALASKNNEEDVQETFRVHPEMPLSWTDFAASRINWESKSTNLVALADELDLGLDSFILIDDNPKECTEVQAGAPEVLALALPADATLIPRFLDHVWAFDRARVTAEDRVRSQQYVQRAERVRAARSAGSLAEFIRSLELDVRISRMQPGELARVAQLTQRTNQMNASCVRRNEAELLALSAAGDAEILTVDVRDRFGGYGLTGVAIVREGAAALVVDTFLLSCRVLGRGVEHRLVARLGEMALARGLAWVEIPFTPTGRNRPAALFFESLATATPGGGFRIEASRAATLRYEPSTGAAAPVIPSNGRGAPAGPAHRIDYARIANELCEPGGVLARIRASAPRQAARTAPLVAPRTRLERELAELWAGLLNLPAVGVDDNFFELGGHSLLAVQLLSRVRQVFRVDLSLEVVYSGDFTVAELAKAIELKELEQSCSGYDDLLKELDGLSDEEVRELLAKEQEME